MRICLISMMLIVWGCTARTPPDTLSEAYLAVLAQANPQAENQFLQQQTDYEPLFLTVLNHTDPPVSERLQRLCIVWLQKDVTGFFTFLQAHYSEHGNLNTDLLTHILGWFYQQQGTLALQYLSALSLSQSGWRACCLTRMMTYLTHHHPQEALQWALAEDPYRYAKIHQWIQTTDPVWLPEMARRLSQLAHTSPFRDTALIQTFLAAYLHAQADEALQWFLNDLPEGPVRHQLLPDFVQYGALYHPEATLRLCNDSTFLRDALSHEPVSTRTKRYTDLLAAFAYGAAQSAKPELASVSLNLLPDRQQAFALRRWLYTCLERSMPHTAWHLPSAQAMGHPYPISAVPVLSPSWASTEVAFKVSAQGQTYAATHTDKDWVVNIETKQALDIHITLRGIACQSAFFEQTPFPVSTCKSGSILAFRAYPGTHYHLRFEQGYSMLVSVF